MHLVMFDIDGTLVDTSAFEDDCFIRAVGSVISGQINTDWDSYTHMSDTGLVNQIICDIVDEEKRSVVFETIRARFIKLITSHLAMNKVSQIAGASCLIEYLKCRQDVVLAIATGGWRETAELKLSNAKIDIADIALASSNDHFDRTKIMKIAQQRTHIKRFESCTYIGDGVWDKTASKALGYNFILIGDKTDHNKKVSNFSDLQKVVSLIGLPE